MKVSSVCLWWSSILLIFAVCVNWIILFYHVLMKKEEFFCIDFFRHILLLNVRKVKRNIPATLLAATDRFCLFIFCLNRWTLVFLSLFKVSCQNNYYWGYQNIEDYLKPSWILVKFLQIGTFVLVGFRI